MNQKIVSEQIKEEISTNKIVLFMKGTSNFPQCGFSATVVSILKSMELEFRDINVLDNNLIRQGIKDYSDWPTIPQLYINGEFIGGSDIIKELYKTGELNTILKRT